jgi:hypothetical protein
MRAGLDPLDAVVGRGGDLRHRLRWSVLRHRHQARARTCTTDDKPPGNHEITIYGWSINLLGAVEDSRTDPAPRLTTTERSGCPSSSAARVRFPDRLCRW